MKKSFIVSVAVLLVFFSAAPRAGAQQYKIRQVSDMMGMKTESTVYVKGMRKRTEPGSLMGMPVQPVTIEQCDLQRTIKLNDKKKLYYIEPFSKETEEVIDEDAKPVSKNIPVTPKEKATNQKGGTIHMWYNITDTGERKKINGFTARHIWTSQKIKPSPDACTMKDSIIIKTDGWYIDLPQFNCPVQYRPSKSTMPPGQQQKPDCMDKFVTHRSGKGKLGFALTETRTIIMGGGGAKTNEFTTSFETPEFSAEKLDSMLFEIPPGYTETKNESDLQDKFDVKDMIKQYGNPNQQQMDAIINPAENNGQKKEGMIRIGVYVPTGDDQVPATSLQQHMVSSLMNGNVEAVAVSSEEEAKKLNCDYTLASEFTRIKQAGKVGGLLKAIKNADPNAASSFTIEAGQTLVKLSDGSIRLQPKINGKFEGKIDMAAEKALDEGCGQVLKELK